jgi:hypothetical protein
MLASLGDWSLPDKGGDLAGQSSFSFGFKRFSSFMGSSASRRPGRGRAVQLFVCFCLVSLGTFVYFSFYFLYKLVCAAFCVGIVFGTSLIVVA